MEVVLSTISKFHTFDTARQLEKRGLLKRLFTGRPRWKMRSEGLPLEKVSCFPYLQTFADGLARLGITRYPLQNDLYWQSSRTLDHHVARHLPSCDVFHGLQYCGLRSGLVARRRGAKYVCDAVNSHILTHEELLCDEHERVGLPYTGTHPSYLEYILESYAAADMITVPSSFAKQSFLDRGVPESRLALVPFGVDVSAYQPIDMPDDDVFRVLFVGQASVRKGIHDLASAFNLANVPKAQLILVGTLAPTASALLRPVAPAALHVMGPRPKSELSRYYSRADVMVLASVEEGLALVIGEAMASGCPVIATEHTGARDFFDNGVEGFIVPIRDPEAIAEKLVWLFEHPSERAEMRRKAIQRVHRMGGWDSFGEQIVAAYQDVVCRPRVGAFGA